MNILIVEDDSHKRRRIGDFVKACLPNSAIVERGSYRSGLSHIVRECPDLILLDMSMPTFDVSETDPGGRTRVFGGRDVLEEMKRRRVPGQVIVVTQFETFGEGTEQLTLWELKQQLERAFPGLYKGSVYYHPAQSDWKAELKELIAKDKRANSDD